MVCKATQEASLYFLNDKHVRNDKTPLLMFLIIISGFSFSVTSALNDINTSEY